MNNDFSVYEFKNWMSSQDNLIKGVMVESKISPRKTISKMCADEGDVHTMAKDFVKGGGTVIEIDGENLKIEVNNGSFFMPKKYIRRRY